MTTTKTIQVSIVYANFTALELRFALIIPKGINATAVADLDDAIVRYSTALSRNI